MSELGMLILVGGGGHAKVVFEAAESAGFISEMGYVDDALGEAALAGLGVECLGGIGEWAGFGELAEKIEGMNRWVRFMGAIGDNAQRKSVMEALAGLIHEHPSQLGGGGIVEGEPFAIVQHASALVSMRAAIGGGSLIGPGAIVNADAVVGAGVILNSGSIVEHDCAVGDYAHVGPGAVLGGGVAIGAGTLVGLGARVLPHVQVGAGVVIGAGAVVCSDVAAGAVVRGIPAR